VGAPGTPASGDAKAFALNQPTGLAMDSANNMYVLDSMEGKVRVISGADRSIHDLNLHENATDAFLADGGSDLKIREVGGDVWLYVADTNHHRIVRANLGPVAGVTGGAMVTIETVFGVKDEPGYIRAGMTYPDILDVSKALGEADARLNTPASFTFDGAGNMIVADKGRIHLLEAAAIDPAVVGDTYVIAGGLDTRFITGDARLAYLPDTAGISFDASSQNLLVVDRKENVVRKLWTARGVR
jgi:sugar lactone lactonase YvrE